MTKTKYFECTHGADFKLYYGIRHEVAAAFAAEFGVPVAEVKVRELR